MIRRSSYVFTLCVGLLAWSPVALAGSQCHIVDHTGPSLTPAWRHAVDSLERELAASTSVTCDWADLVLTEEGGGVRVSAKAHDGRETSRRVGSPSGLSAVAFGLLAVAPGEPTPLPEDPLETPPPPEPVPPKAPPAPPEWDVSLSAATGVRGAFPSNVLLSDVEARVDVRVHASLLTLHVRAAPFVLAMSGPYDSDSFQETAFGLGAGHRFQLGRLAIAITGTADVAYVWIENDLLNASSERAQLRLGAVARLGYPLGRAVRLSAALDADVSPTDLLNGPAPAGLPPYPIFTVGVRLGVEVML